MWDPGSDAWLAGFADGEGTFTLGLKRQRRGDVYEVVGVPTRARIERVIAETGYVRGAKTGRAKPTLRRVV